MKTITTLVILVLAVFSKTLAQSQDNAITGFWESDKKDVKMEIFKDGETYSGKYLWGNQLVESDGITSKKDVKNPDPKLRSRNLLGIISLTGLKWDGKEYINGKIYNAPSGDMYNCKAWIEDSKMNLRGFMGVSFFGKTATFHRFKQK